MQAVILAGGKGTRLASRLQGRPKPLVEVGGVPLLERQLRALASHGVTSAVILVNHLAEQIEAFLAQREFGCRTKLIDDGAPRGTSGAVLACLAELEERFLVVYGDTLFDLDIAAMVEAHVRAGADATLLLHPNDHPADSDLVEVDDDGRIAAFHGYPHAPGRFLPNLVNAAFYVVEKSMLTPYRDTAVPSDFAKDLFPAALRDGRHLHGYRSFEYIKDLGTPTRLDKVERHLASGVVARARRRETQRAVFIDRDGTLNVLRGYVRTPEELTVLPGVTGALRRLNEAEWRTVVVTNQPVLARGECSPAGMRAIHAKLDTELGRDGVYLDAVYVCPHHPHGGFAGEVATLKIDCGCRKPKAGLIDRAVVDMNIEPSRSFMVGDSTTDVEAARRAGVSSILVGTGEAGRDGRVCARPDFVADDLADAVSLILDRIPAMEVALAAAALVSATPAIVHLEGPGRRLAASVLAARLRREGAAVSVTDHLAPPRQVVTVGGAPDPKVYRIRVESQAGPPYAQLLQAEAVPQ